MLAGMPCTFLRHIRYASYALFPHQRVEMSRTARAARDALSSVPDLIANGDFQEAARVCGELLSSRPNSVPALMGLGESLRAQGDLTGAIAAFQRASELRPRDAQPLV